MSEMTLVERLRELGFDGNPFSPLGHEAADEIERLAKMAQPVDERTEFEKAWAKRPWHTEPITDKDKAWGWWSTRAALPRS